MNESYKVLLEQYIFWLDTLGFARIRRYGDRVRDFFMWLENKNISSINQITQKHITTFFDYQQARENKKYGGTLSNVYLNDYYTAIDKLCEFLHQMGMQNAPVPINRRIAIDEDERVRKIEPFTIEEIKTLQNTIESTYPNQSYEKRQTKHYQLKLIFTLYYGCGMRLSEGYNLTVKDIDFNRRTIFIRQGKGYKDRIVPMNDNVYNALLDYTYNFRNQIKCGHARLFLHTPASLLKYLHHLQSLCDNEDIQPKRISFHILRHSIATHLLQNGMTIENIARFLGHSSLASTQIYTHIISR
jgi:integrase/recombinase XerD